MNEGKRSEFECRHTQTHDLRRMASYKWQSLSLRFRIYKKNTFSMHSRWVIDGMGERFNGISKKTKHIALRLFKTHLSQSYVDVKENKRVKNKQQEKSDEDEKPHHTIYSKINLNGKSLLVWQRAICVRCAVFTHTHTHVRHIWSFDTDSRLGANVLPRAHTHSKYRHTSHFSTNKTHNLCVSYFILV